MVMVCRVGGGTMMIVLGSECDIDVFDVLCR